MLTKSERPPPVCRGGRKASLVTVWSDAGVELVLCAAGPVRAVSLVGHRGERLAVDADLFAGVRRVVAIDEDLVQRLALLEGRADQLDVGYPRAGRAGGRCVAGAGGLAVDAPDLCPHRRTVD